MTVSVWADVGGTFTDCFVVDGSERRATKVLSSGVVYAQVTGVSADGSITVDAFPAAEVRGFWASADASIVDASGTLTPIGTVTRQIGRTIELSNSRAAEIKPGTSLCLDARLESPVLAARILLGVPIDHELPNLDVRLGTTRGTNALLTRRGAKTALLVTSGFGDILRIGQQDRPDLFALAIVKPKPLTETVIEVCERLDRDGNALTPINVDQLRRDLIALRSDGVESIAIALMHAHVNDLHERIAEDLARDVGFDHISRSSEVAPLIKLVSRAETTTLDAYLNPILAGYAGKVWSQFGGETNCRFRLMTSNGNLVSPADFRGRDSILSGPAGGVVALAKVARRYEADRAIGIDMGGTSTDVSRFEGTVGRRQESRVAGIRVMTPMMDIETVAAGGGSICDYVDGRLTVGPASAGADPGPACYGRGGPLTVTDVNLLLGRIPESRFPFALDRDASQRQIESIADRISSDAFTCTEQLAEGFLQIAITHMAEAVRTVSTAQGVDVREMALVGFGGASGQHLCRVATALGMKRILDHPDAGMLSALGMGLADIGRVVARGVYRPLSDITVTEFEKMMGELREETNQMLVSETSTTNDSAINHQFECDVRYQGTDASLTISLQPIESIADRFVASHQSTFGYHQPERSIELVAVRGEATIHHPVNDSNTTIASASANPTTSKSIWHDGKTIEAKLIDRVGLQTGDSVTAPAMIVGDHSTLLVEPGWRATVLSGSVIELTPAQTKATATSMVANANHRSQGTPDTDPVLIEVIARRLQGIADAMGEVLRRTSVSVNVKERLDYSCAVFRGDGSLIANAPHVPVHLGAMGHTVRHMMQVFPIMSAGDAYLSNDPFAGGSHLPDVTLVTPVFCDTAARDTKPDFFVASRAHHAEIGGRTPGSMPPDAQSLAEEGVLISAFPLVRGNVSRFDELQALLGSGQFPSRSVYENLADIAAAQAAGMHGAAALRELAATHSASTVDDLMGQILDLAGDSMHRWIASLSTDPMDFSDTLDDGTSIAVRIQRIGSRLSIHFT
ncbi:MAG: hydantoinase/oxoprolinase family protein, partial [Rubripirellula sp.]